MSVSSNGRYNRTFGTHPRNDSSANSSSVAQSYARHGTLTSISASPLESARNPHLGNLSSFDFIIDDKQRSSLGEGPLFEITDYRPSMLSDSVFGDDCSQSLRSGLLPPNQFRPLSVASINSIHSPLKDDDTVISVSFFNFFCSISKFQSFLYYKC